MELLIIWVLFSIFSGILARSKKRAVFGWALVGLLFGPFGLIVGLLPTLESQHQPNKISLSPCKKCKELIQFNAKVCRYCGTSYPYLAEPARTHVDHISKLYAKGDSPSIIADRLNQKGIRPADSQREWTETSIEDIIQNHIADEIEFKAQKEKIFAHQLKEKALIEHNDSKDRKQEGNEVGEVEHEIEKGVEKELKQEVGKEKKGVGVLAGLFTIIIIVGIAVYYVKELDWRKKWGTRYKPGECQEVYVPGDSKPMCESGLITYSTSTRSSERSASSSPSSSGSTVSSEKGSNSSKRKCPDEYSSGDYYLTTPEWFSRNGHCLSIKQKQKMESELYVVVKKIPASKVKENRDGYKGLLILNTDNQMYMDKLAHYEAKYEEKKELDWRKKWGARYKPGECQEVYIPGDSKPMCESGLIAYSTSINASSRSASSRSRSASSSSSSSSSTSSRSKSSGPKVESEKELNCLMRLVIERKQGKNSMSDGGITTLCDQLF